MTKSLMAGIDLHSNNLFCAIADLEGKRVFQKKLPCEISAVITALKPFKSKLRTVAVESTYNWYWLVDGLQDAGYAVSLANPAKMQQYSGLKHSGDESDAFFLAELLRLNILPSGYICERKVRAARDLLRRRTSLVQKRTSLIVSFKSLQTRTLGRSLSLGEVKALEPQEAGELFVDPNDRLIAEIQVRLLGQLDESIGKLEKAALKHANRMPSFSVLQSLPGVGKVLGLTMSLETVDISRFATAGDYASYCRCVDSTRISNQKKKGENNKKCGNRYLAWAFVEAANMAKRYDEQCRRFYDRKAAQTNTIVATKSLACKLAKAAWHMMRDQKEYDPSRMFPGRPAEGEGKAQAVER